MVEASMSGSTTIQDSDSDSKAGQVAATAGQESAEVASAAVEKGKEVARTAADESKRVAETGREQIGQVTGQVVEQSRNLAVEARTQLKGQAEAQTQKAAQSLRRLESELRALGEGRVDEAPQVKDLVQQAAARAASYAGQVETKGFDGLVSDLKQFARSRPGTFLLGSVAVGFGLSRVARGTAAGQQEQQAQRSGNGLAVQPSLGPSGSSQTGMSGRDAGMVPPAPAPAQGLEGRA